ncbi:MAG: hypothetical protein ACTHMS_12350 [Jatrophihabitans sp.]|uniref:hypothetical protein n=1 Tax=Jatrophihabitans sp. TaxID=1932789 RepID=UPI003F7F1B81
MTAGRVRIEVAEGAAFVAGPGGIVKAALKAARSSRRWDPDRRRWRIPVAKVDDVVFMIKRLGGDVDLELVVR